MTCISFQEHQYKKLVPRGEAWVPREYRARSWQVNMNSNAICLYLSQSTSVQQIGNSSKRMVVWIGSAVLSRWLRMILAPFLLILFNRQVMRWTCQQYQLYMELLQRMHFLLIIIVYWYQWTFQRSRGIKRVKIPPSRDVYCMSASSLKLIIGYVLFCHLHIVSTAAL